MKKLIVLLALAIPSLTFAQNTWETETAKVEETRKVEVPNPDQKYLEGAVPVVDGKVAFVATFKAPGKSVREVYNAVGRTMTAITKEDNQLEGSRVVYADTTKNEIAANIEEWLVFKSNAIQLDRTRFRYAIIAECREGEATITISRINYIYDEGRDEQRFTAEEWITDQYGLRSNKQKLARISGKFRKKTIDRKDYLFTLFDKAFAK